MSAQMIFDHVQLGALISYFDGTLRPGKDDHAELARWHSRNGSGRLVRKWPEPHIGDLSIPASFTLERDPPGPDHLATFRVLRTFAVDSDLKFAVTERPPDGSVRILDRSGGDARLVHLAGCRADAESWLRANGHPDVVLEEITADEAAADVVEGRAAA